MIVKTGTFSITVLKDIKLGLYDYVSYRLVDMTECVPVEKCFTLTT